MGTSALNPKNATFLEKDSLEPMAQLYVIKKDDLLAETHQMRRLGKKKEKGETVSSTLEFLSMHPNPTKTPLRTSINFCAYLLHCL